MNDMIQEPNTTFPHSKTTESRRVSIMQHISSSSSLHLATRTYLAQKSFSTQRRKAHVQYYYYYDHDSNPISP